jgi:SOS-response transcriptional repressor LexA
MTRIERILSRIEKRLEETGLSAAGVSKAAGKPDAIRNIRRAVDAGKDYQISAGTLTALAEQLGMSAAELMGEDGPALAMNMTAGLSVAVLSIPVRGYVQAGMWMEFEDFEHDNHDDIQIAPVLGPWSGLKQVAYKVKGDSMDADHIFDGDYVICVEYFSARPDLMAGDTCVIERVRNSAVERTVKAIEIDGKNVQFAPRSNNPRYKPISVKVNRHIREADDTEVRVVGLVVGVWRPR